VLGHAAPDFVLLPEIHLNKGRALKRLGEGGKAASEFQKAIALRPDYAPAYAALSDFYSDLGDVEEARRILGDGLRHAPKSKMLKRRLAGLKE